jgi:RNA polymerase sigma factor (sigma-70 family)
MDPLDGSRRSGEETTHGVDARGSRQRRPGSRDEPEPGERALVRAAMEGSTAACDALYRRHAPTAWRVAQAVTHNPDDAADAVAEAFTRVFTALPSGRLASDLAFRPYLLAATRNAAIDGIRKAGRLRPTDEIERFDRQTPASGPSERLMIGEDRDKMAEAFAALPERWRSVLWMTEVEEMPAREVAKRLGLTANGVAQLAVRARAGLRLRYLQAHVRNHARPRCAQTVERLGAYVGGGLAPRDIAKVDQHLAGCADCTARLGEVEDVGATLRRIALPLPLGLGAMALKQLGLGFGRTAAGVSRRAMTGPGNGGLRRAAGAAAGAGALVAGLGGMAFVGPLGSAPRTVARPPAVTAVPAARPSSALASPAPAPAGATTSGTTTVAPPAVPQSPAGGTPVPEPPRPPVPVGVPPLPMPPLPSVSLPSVSLPSVSLPSVSLPSVSLPPVSLPPLPVGAAVGVSVGGVAVGAGVGSCTGVAAGPVKAGCPPSTPNGSAVHAMVAVLPR